MKFKLFLLYTAVLLLPGISYGYNGGSLLASVYCSTLGSWIRDVSCLQKQDIPAEENIIPNQEINYITNPTTYVSQPTTKVTERVVSGLLGFDTSNFVTKDFLKQQAWAIGDAHSNSTSNILDTISSLTTSNISEGTNLYYTDDRVAAYITASSTLGSGSNYWTKSGSDLYYTDGKVGIGTSTPSFPLYVYASAQDLMYLENSAGAAGLQLHNNNNSTNQTNGSIIGVINFSTYFNSSYNPGGQEVSQVAGVYEGDGTNRVGAIRFGTSNGASPQERVRINKYGDFGIATTSPYAKLSVTSTAIASTTLALRPVASQTGNVIDIYSTTGTLTSVVKSSGNWGIGTSSPTSKLSVAGDISTMATSSGVSVVWAVKNLNFADRVWWLYDSGNVDFKLNYPLTNTDLLTFDMNGGLAGFGTSTPYAALSVTNATQGPSFVVEDQTSPDPTPFIVDPNGRVGIGTSSPASQLSIRQSANTSSNGYWQAGTDGDFRSVYVSDTSGTLSFFGGDTAGSLNTATLNSAGAWTNASDRSYKENIVDLNTKYTLDTLLSIQPRFYTMKGTGKPQIGFIAQELKLVLPEVVEGTDGSMGISYGNMVALLVTAVKELNGKVEKVSAWFKGDKLNIQNDVCVDDVCITKEQFKLMLLNSGAEVIETPINKKVKSENGNSNATSTTESSSISTTTPEIVINNASSTPSILPDTQSTVVPEITSPVVENIKDLEPILETNSVATSTNP